MMRLKLRPEAQELWIQLAVTLGSSQEMLGASWAVVPRIENGVVCIIKVAFLFAFFTVHLASRRISDPGSGRAPRLLESLAAALAGLVSVAHLGVLIWLAVAESALAPVVWVFFVAQAVSWLGLAISLRLLPRLRPAARITASIWWSSAFLMNSVLSAWSLFTLVAESEITIYGILSLASWPICCLVLACAIRGFNPPQFEDEDLVRPLLNGDDKLTNITPMATSGWIRLLAFSWLNPLLSLGHSKTLELSDIPELPEELSAQRNHHLFAEELRQQKLQGMKKLSVAGALTRSFGREFVITGLLALLKTLATSVSPLFIYYFVELITSGGKGFKIGGYSIILLMCATKLLQSLAQRHWSFRSRLAGARLRSAVIAEVHEKQLRLATGAKQRHGAGEIVSYIGVDAYRLGDFSWWMHYTWTSLLQLLLSLAILVNKIGLATAACVVVLIVTACIQIPTSKRLKKSQTSFMGAQDRRLRATTEILSSMKIIKLQAWEEEFKEIIRGQREEELTWLRRMHGMRGCSLITFWFSYTIAIGIALGTYSLVLGNTLTASLVFTVFSAFGNTQEPVRIVPELLSILSQVRVSLFRLDRFLQDEEIDPNAVDRKSLQGQETVARVRDGSFSWSGTGSDEKKTLTGINFEIQRGQKVAVCGAVGSGKTSLLSALLGEIPKHSGTVQLYGSIAYVSQSAWIQTGTIRDNVLFGKPYDEQKYKDTLKACALESDLKILPHGDQTEIGERGLNLSGGQKQRVQLARAVYNDADVYLLDDPFSAVDAHTAATLFHDCVMKALGSKTVILVTHQVEFLPAVDKILVMEGGMVLQSGRYEELIDSGLAFEKLVNAHKEALENFNNNQQGSEEDSQEYEGHSEFKRSVSLVRRNSSKKRSESGTLTASQLTEKEEKEIGELGLQPYKDYINISQTKFWFYLDLFSQFVLVAGQAASTLWLAQLVQFETIDAKLLVGGYTLISWSTSFFFVVRMRAHVNMGLKASGAFFYKLMDALFKAPMSFFDTTPTGRILSRASTDMSLLDIDLNQISNIMIAFMFDLPSSFLLLIYVVWPYVFFVVPMLYMVKRVESFFRATAQQVMRLNAMTKAPIVNFSGETVSGVASIRAFGVAEEFKEKNIRLLNRDASVYMHNYAVMEWLVIRVETCGTILMLIFGVLLSTFDIVPGLAGMGLSYGNLVNTSLVVLSQWYCQLSNVVVSVERIKQYMNIPSEAPPVIESNRPPREWPSKGAIRLDNLQLRYRPTTPLVLKGITCRIEGGHKVGVVGRTGSGKSTLIGALFRLVEPAGGRIFIDGVDICTIGLRDLRTKLGIIPQEPTLFRGTVRTNLDPLGVYSDQDIWETLDKCQMGGEIRGLAKQLESEVADEGGNWSAGQRQLFCLGRVLLRRARILVLDEATASIDSTTDAILQRVLREEFASCTVVTVAHRIPTVIDSDRVMALQDGRLAEYDSPQKLLHVPDSLFGKLVKEYWAQSGANVKH